MRKLSTAFALLLGLSFICPNINYAQTEKDLQDLLEESDEKGKKEEKTKKEKQPKEKAVKESKERREKVKDETEESVEETAEKVKSSSKKGSSKTAKYVELSEEQKAKLGPKKSYRIGKKLFAEGGFYNSSEFFGMAYGKRPKAKFAIGAAESNYLVRDFASSAKWYKRVLDADTNKLKIARFNYAMSLKQLGGYEEAKFQFNRFMSAKYKKKDPALDLMKHARREKKGCDLGIQLRSSKIEWEVKNAGEEVNSPYTNFVPRLISKSGLIYSSLKTDQLIYLDDSDNPSKYARSYTSKANNGNWAAGELMKDAINSGNTHIGNASLSSDGNTLYFTQCKLSEEGKMKMRCQIYYSTKEQGEFKTAKLISGNINEESSSSTHPFITKDEDDRELLFFTSDRRENRGFDVYMAYAANDGKFERAKNVGGKINTSMDETTPYYDAKTSTLYFSSNGLINMGGMDVYSCTKDENGDWQDPVHLGKSVNSPNDDWYFNLNGKNKGVMVSNRPGGYSLKSATCCDDIYMVNRAGQEFAVRGTLYANMGGNIEKANDGSISLFADNDSLLNIYNIKEGGWQYFFDLKPDKDYFLVTVRDGFEDVLTEISTKGYDNGDTLVIDLFQKSLADWINYKIGVVYFEFDQSYLTKNAPATLDSVVYFMNIYGDLTIEVGGYTDAIGSKEYNFKLSQQRAESVKKYLVSKKIADDRLLAIGYGETHPMAENKVDGKDNPEGRKLNRRVEFTVVDEVTANEIREILKLIKSKNEESAE